MKTVWDDTARAALLRRFSSLTADRTPRWGQFNAPAMVQHCLGSLRMFLGELPVAPRKTPLKIPLIRHAVIYWLPWPKGAPTAPELLAPPEGDLAVLLDSLKAALDRAAARNQSGTFTEHPAFGRLSNKDAGALIHRHFDHHLRQFGA